MGVTLLLGLPLGVAAARGGHGSRDPSFGKGGIVTTAIGSGADAQAVVIQPDGKIVAAGPTWGAQPLVFALARYNRDGSLDRGFGAGGKVRTLLGFQARNRALVMQKDGKLVTAGDSLGSHSVFALLATTRTAPRLLVVQPDGKLVASGDGFTLLRYNRDGSVDRSFGSRGKATTAVGSSWSRSPPATWN